LDIENQNIDLPSEGWVKPRSAININKRSCLFLLTDVFLQVLPAIVVGAWHWTAERQPLDRLQSPKTSKERKLSLIVYGGCLALVTCFFFVTQHSQWQPL
jgi:hypothetical protein